jgi:hypothetical protein
VQTDGASAAETVSSSLNSDLDATWSCLFDAGAAYELLMLLSSRRAKQPKAHAGHPITAGT